VGWPFYTSAGSVTRRTAMEGRWIMRNLRALIGALTVAGLLMGCAGTPNTQPPQSSAAADCKRSGGFWTGAKCDFSGAGGGGGY